MMFPFLNQGFVRTEKCQGQMAVSCVAEYGAGEEKPSKSSEDGKVFLIKYREKPI